MSDEWTIRVAPGEGGAADVLLSVEADGVGEVLAAWPFPRVSSAGMFASALVNRGVGVLTNPAQIVASEAQWAALDGRVAEGRVAVPLGGMERVGDDWHWRSVVPSVDTPSPDSP